MAADTSSSAPAKGLNLLVRRSPREFLDFFLELWWVGLLVGLAAGTLLFFLYPRPKPLYRAEVSLVFETKRNRVVNMTEVVDTSLQSVSDLNTHMEQLRSTTFFQFLLASLAPDEVKKLEEAEKDPLDPKAAPTNITAILRSGVSVFNRRGTPILGLAVSNRNPESAAFIANVYAKRYIDFTLDRANTGTTSAIIFLRSQAEDLRRQVETAEAQLQVFRAKNNLAALGENQNLTLERARAIGAALVNAQLGEMEARALVERLDELLASKDDPSLSPLLSGDPQVAAALATRSGVQSQRLALEERYLRRHPKMLQNDFDLKEAQRVLDERLANLIQNLRARHSLAAQNVKRLEVERANAERDARDLDKTSVEYRFLEEDAKTKRSTYARLMDRLNEATITSRLENANIRIFDLAQVPGAPAETGVLQIALRSALLGLAFLLVIPLGLGLLDSRIRTPSQIEGLLGQSILGAVPPLPKLNNVERATLYLSKKDPNFIEALRGIFSEIELRSTLANPRLLLLSSSVPEEGKSQVACNLAAVFAAHHHRILLVDCDLRRPRLHKYLSRETRLGWTEVLGVQGQEKASLLPCVETFAPNFDFLPAGPSPTDPTELLEQFAKKDVLAELLQAYDLVLLDTPPVCVFPDALILAQACHELILVCRYRTVPSAILRQVQAKLAETEINFLGVILNRLPHPQNRNSGYAPGYGSYSKNYYSHYGEDKDPSPAKTSS